MPGCRKFVLVLNMGKIGAEPAGRTAQVDRIKGTEEKDSIICN